MILHRPLACGLEADLHAHPQVLGGASSAGGALDGRMRGRGGQVCGRTDGGFPSCHSMHSSCWGSARIQLQPRSFASVDKIRPERLHQGVMEVSRRAEPLPCNQTQVLRKPRLLQQPLQPHPCPSPPSYTFQFVGMEAISRLPPKG